MHHKKFPNKNRKTRLLENQFWQNSKIQTPDMAKISWPRDRRGKTPQKHHKRTRSTSPFVIVIKGVREFFREKFHDQLPPRRWIELCKQPKTRRGIYRNNKPQNNGQHFPLSLTSVSRGGGLGASMPKSPRRISGYARNSARNSKFHSWTDSITTLHWQQLNLRLAGQVGARAPRAKKKNAWGGNKNVRGEPRSNPKRAPPPPKQKALGAVRLGPCDPNQTQETRQKQHKEGTNPPPLRGTPWPSLGRGAGRRAPVPAVGRAIGGPSSKTCAAANKTEGEKKQQKRSTRTPPQVPGESQKRVGPRTAPRENAKKQDARPKRAINQTQRDKKETKERPKQARVGCPGTT